MKFKAALLSRLRRKLLLQKASFIHFQSKMYPNHYCIRLLSLSWEVVRAAELALTAHADDGLRAAAALAHLEAPEKLKNDSEW